MNVNRTHIAEALIRVNLDWQAHAAKETGCGPSVPALTIALSREAGTYGAAIAREVGDRLGWPVYDSELLQRIADDMGVRRTLLESVDERHVDWLSESLAGFLSAPAVGQVAYFRHLVETVLSLGTHGECVIVGRGATTILPIATTLRVRVVAPLDHRVEAVKREHGITLKEAATRVENTDRERNRFVTNHFRIDATDPRNYDLVLNVARFSIEECADIIVAALDRLRAQQTPTHAKARPQESCQDLGRDTRIGQPFVAAAR